MKKIIIKSLIAVFAVAFLIFGTVSFSIIAGADEANIAAGTVGDGVSWVISADGTLVISGSGTFNFEWYSPPWKDYKDVITSVRIEEGVTRIPDSLLVFLDSAKKIYIPSTVEYIEALAFDNSYGIEEFIVSEDNSVYKSEDGIIYSKDGITLVRFPAASPFTEFTIPETVSYISNEAFACSCNLRVINIGENVLGIGSNAFYNSNIESVTFESPASSIESSLFAYSDFASFVIPDTVEYIGSSAFFDIKPLESLVIGSGVKEIGTYVFEYTPNLSVIHYHGTEESWNAISIEDHNESLLEKEIHFVAYADGREATCAEGHEGGLYCETCDEYFTGEAISPIMDHTRGEATNVESSPATCDEDGYYYAEFRCTTCDELLDHVYEVTEAATGHNIVSGVCDVCGEECSHVDVDYDGACDDCEKPDAFQYTYLEVGVSYTVSVSDGDYSDEMVIFCPEESGYYVITSHAPSYGPDPYVEIYDEDGGDLGSNDDFGGEWNFRLEFEALAGKAYIIYLREWGESGGTYSYILNKSYRIVSHPTSASPEVVVNFGGADSYQWYEYRLGAEITAENATALNEYGDGSAYVEGKGWTGDFWEEGEGSFFLVELKAGDGIYLDFGHSIDSETGIWGYTVNEGLYLDGYDDDGKLLFVATFDDVFEIYSYSVDENTYLRAYLLEKVELDGETSSKLNTFEIGSMYSCEALVRENVLISDIFVCEYAVSHAPNSDEPYIEVNVGEATYQWSETVLSGEVTDEIGSIVDWERGEASSYDEVEGWSGVLDMYGEDDCYDFVTVFLDKGQKVTVVVEGNYHNGVGLYDYTTENGVFKEDSNGAFNLFTFKISKDGEYTVYTYSSDGSARVKVYLENESVEIEGATDNILYAKSDGYYIYSVTFENGDEYSGTVYLTAHEHTDEDADYTCDECEAELPGKPDDSENTGSGGSNTGSSDDEGKTDEGEDNDNSNADNSGDNTPLEISLGDKIVIAAVAVSLIAVIMIAFIVIKKRS